jgi:DNA-binding Lrp family transcriptional regulator
MAAHPGGGNFARIDRSAGQKEGHMAKVYMLANVLAGKERFIRDTLRGTKGVVNADMITGAYDLVVVLEAKDMNDIFNKILKDLRKIKGLTRTETFVAVE